jgi:hypothetical protein
MNLKKTLLANGLLKSQLEISILSNEEESKQNFISKALRILTEINVVSDAFFRSSKTVHSLCTDEIPDYRSLRSVMANQGNIGKLPEDDDLYLLKIGDEPGELSFIGLRTV